MQWTDLAIKNHENIEMGKRRNIMKLLNEVIYASNKTNNNKVITTIQIMT